MNITTSTSFQKSSIFVPALWKPFAENRIEEIIEEIEYLLRNGGNANGVQREVNEIVPEIESLLKELKKAIREEKKKTKEPKKNKKK